MLFRKSGAVVIAGAMFSFANLGAAHDWVAAASEDVPAQFDSEPTNLVATCQSVAQQSMHTVWIESEAQGYRVRIDRPSTIPNQPEHIEKLGFGTRATDSLTIRFFKDGAYEKGSISIERTGKDVAKGTLILDDNVSVPLTCKLVADRVFPHRFDGFYLKNCSNFDATVTKIDIRSGSRATSTVLEAGVLIAAGQQAKFGIPLDHASEMYIYSNLGRSGCFRYMAFDNAAP